MIPAQSPSAKGALAEVQTGQSPIWPIPIGRATRSRSRISKAARITFTTSGYLHWSRCASTIGGKIISSTPREI